MYRTYVSYHGTVRFLRTVPLISVVKQRSINDICDLCWRVFCLYLIRIIPKDKLKAAFLKRVNGSTQSELNELSSEPKKKGSW